MTLCNTYRDRVLADSRITGRAHQQLLHCQREAGPYASRCLRASKHYSAVRAQADRNFTAMLKLCGVEDRRGTLTAPTLSGLGEGIDFSSRQYWYGIGVGALTALGLGYILWGRG